MKKKFLVFITLLALGMFALPVSAGRASVSHFSGDYADAYFSSLDPTGCIQTDIFVSAARGKIQEPPGPGSSASEAFIALSQYDFCTETQLLNAGGSAPLTRADFRFIGKGRSAQLTRIVEVFDWVSNTSFEVSVNLAWEAIVPATRANDHYHASGPGFSVNFHSNGVSQSAEASGTVSVLGNNLLSGPSLFASAGSSKAGSVFVSQ